MSSRKDVAEALADLEISVVALKGMFLRFPDNTDEVKEQANLVRINADDLDTQVRNWVGPG